MGCNVFTTSCNFLKHSKYIWVVNVTSGKKAEICVLHPAHAKTAVAQGEAAALKCLSTVGLFCVPTHGCPHRETPLHLHRSLRGAGSPSEPHSDDVPRRVRGEGFCGLSVGPGREKLLLAASTNNLPLWLLPGKSFKSRQGCSAITWLTWKHSKH